MSTIPVSGQLVLRDASAAQLEQAVAENHRQLFCDNARALGGVVNVADGLTYTYTPANGSAVVFPSLTSGNAGAQLDAMMDFYRANQAQHVGYWSLAPTAPADVGAYLLARGFQPGWEPCWMALDLDVAQTDELAPAKLEIRASNDTPVHDVEGLPYNDTGGPISDALFHTWPEKVQRFVAFLDGVIAGQCCLFFTTGANGIAGMYSVGVVPSMRRKGIGKAIVLAACRYAKEHGYQYVMLNANGMGRPVYERAGFQVIGHGITWWLMGQRYITHPPARHIVSLAEATGRGEIAALEKMGASATPEELNTPLTNGMTLLQLAAHCRQPAAAEWLIEHGASLTALDAWDLGWKERAAALLAAHPPEVNRTYFDWQGTLLHIAAQRGDIALAQLALNAGVDLSIKDKEHDAIALGWAYYFHRREIIALIEKHSAGSGS
ncbi:GNAT family N-acetyltransferase [Pseudoflavitalea sp. X16]|uniref:GNAT family N-acetyltransferase n=1 Tax=Paraflavitalea devenefica TaxID=2716334 RepID=UPI001421CF50|nr:GNAT family N-acetyltransferase [Paraflavitalea devenefica]NII28524.1 GNAT family N-acetyltransferase [Paraflavitalea devenefica]